MEKILAAYSFSLGQYQDIASLMDRMAKEGKDRHDLRDYVRRQAQSNKKAEKLRLQIEKDFIEKMSKCPKCQSNMWPYPVNSNQRDQIGGPWKSQLVCGKPDCGYEEFSEETPEQIFKKHGLEG